jgi:hypothetical protein
MPSACDSLRLVGWLTIAVMVGCGSADQVVLGQGIDAGESVVAFVLVDVANGMDKQVLADGATIDVSSSPVTLRVQTEPAVVGSVAFYLDGAYVRTEEHSLYAIAGNSPTTGVYSRWTPAPGMHVVKATPFSLSSMGGVAGTSLEQTFLIQ